MLDKGCKTKEIYDGLIDVSLVVAFYDPSDLTDLITVGMHYSYIYMQFLNMQFPCNQ